MSLQEIDDALSVNDIKRAEVAIARHLRDGRNTPRERAELLYRRAQARLMDARPDDAREDVETAIALIPEKSEEDQILSLLGDIYFARFELAPVGFTDRSDTDTALSYYRQVSEDSELISWVNYQMGRILLSRNESDEAVRYFQKILTIPPNPPYIHALAHERIGFVRLFENRQPQQALEHFQKAEASYKDQQSPGWLVQLYIRMSRTYLELDEHDAALESARKALRQIQNSSTNSYRDALPDAHLAIADVMSVMPDYESEAIEHYLRFLQSSKRPPGIDVTWSQVHQTIGELSFRLERYQQAISAFEKALEFNPYHPWEVNLRFQVARCHYRMRAYERAVATLEKTLRQAEEEATPIADWRIFNLLGNAFFALEQYPEAAKAYRQALTHAHTGVGSLEKTRIYLRFAEELSQSSTQ